MSGYIIEEPNDIPIYHIDDNEEINEYWKLHSIHQKKRFRRVLNQINNTWFNVCKTMSIMRNNGLSIDDCNNIMGKIHNLFFIEYKYIIQYYNEEKIRNRKNKNYYTKQINKLKNSKHKL